jgi:heptosyltransferase-2
MFKGVKDMYDRNPNFNNVYYSDFLNQSAVKSLMFVLKLRKKYDASVNIYPSNRKEYNLINYFIGAKKRAGVKYLRRNGTELGILNNVRITEDDSLHNVQENIKLVEKLFSKKFNEEPPLNFPLTNEDLTFADGYLKELNIIEGDLVIGFHPGCATLKNHIKRRWEPEKFIELGKRLIQQNNAKLLIFGGPEEDELKQSIRTGINSPDVYSVKTNNLPESVAVLKRCNLFVSNDSSMMHIASAVNKKVVAIIGPTNSNYIHPWKTEHKIVTLNLDCAPCFIYSPRPLICFRDDFKFKCIKELNVDMVYDAIKMYL